MSRLIKSIEISRPERYNRIYPRTAINQVQKDHNRRNKNMVGPGQRYPQEIRGHPLEGSGANNVPSKPEEC